MYSNLSALMRRLESAQARQNDAFNRASQGASRPLGGGFAHFRGDGHPLNQALGLLDPISEAELEVIEAFLGAPTVLELSPGADPDLWPLLAKRSYRLQQFQQQLARPVNDVPPLSTGAELRPARSEEYDLHAKLLGAGFSERDDWRTYDPPFALAPEAPHCLRLLAFVDGEPAGGAVLGWVDGVALFSGDAVLPRFRGRGLQKAMIRARLHEAARLGCDLATASTLPATPSQQAYEACGFRVMYPKVEMAKG